jgi:hypothetical protein
MGMYTRAVSRTWGRRPHAACAPWSRRRARGTRHAMTTALHSRPFQCGCGAVHDSLNKDVTARVGVQCGPFLENKRTGKRKSKRYATREVNTFVLALVFLSKLPSAKSTRLVLARSARLVYSLQGQGHGYPQARPAAIRYRGGRRAHPASASMTQDAPAGGHKHSCGMNVILPYNIYA